MEKRLYRNESDKMIAGVCSGLADYFEMEVTWMRIIFVFAAIFGFSGFIIYLILWVVIPARPFSANYSSFNADYRVYEDKTYTPPASGAMHQPTPMPPYMTKSRPNTGKGRLIAGLILVGLGAYFLLDEFDIIPDWVDFGRLWPLIIVVLGVLLLTKGTKKAVESTEEPTVVSNPDVTDSETKTTSNPEQPFS